MIKSEGVIIPISSIVKKTGRKEEEKALSWSDVVKGKRDNNRHSGDNGCLAAKETAGQ